MINNVKHKILLVEDEAAIRSMLRLPLEREGFLFLEAENTQDAMRIIEDESPSLLVLDWMLPQQSGIDFARMLKRNKKTSNLPIIMLTARTMESDKLYGFDVGVDDYVTKPFSVKELLARIHAVLRRYTDEDSDKEILIDGLSIMPEFHRVTANGQTVKLGPTEFRLLYHFMKNPERVHSRGQLLNQVWGETVYVEERTVDVHIRRLRKALEGHKFDRFIQTVRSAGYRFSSKDNG